MRRLKRVRERRKRRIGRLVWSVSLGRRVWKGGVGFGVRSLDIV